MFKFSVEQDQIGTYFLFPTSHAGGDLAGDVRWFPVPKRLSK
jgi:hypothetical protein